MFLSNHTFWDLAVVPCYLQILLFEPLSNNIYWHLSYLNGVCGESMAQQMGFEDHRFSLFCLKDHPVEEEAHTCGNGASIEVMMAVLKQIRCRFKAVCSPICRGECNSRKWLTIFKLVVLFEHSPCFFNQPESLFRNEVVAGSVGLFTLRNQTKQVADTGRTILCSWWRIIDKTHQAISRQSSLHQFIDTKSSCRKHIQH